MIKSIKIKKFLAYSNDNQTLNCKNLIIYFAKFSPKNGGRKRESSD